jgi:tRNA(Ile)-lysidine synthase
MKKQATKIDLTALESLMPSGSRVLMAASGGIDSTVCAHVLATGTRKLGLSIGLAYIHHGLRDAADREQLFVEKIATELGAEFHSVRITVGKKPGLQDRARRLRYEALSTIADEQGFDFIATGHNRDDQAETVLFRALRGAGVAGLSGIPERSGRVVRPLLTWSREKIVRYADQHGIESLEDASNASDDYTRNRLRNKLLPALEEAMGADVRAPLARLAQISTLERGALRELAHADLNRVVEKKGPGGGIRTDRLKRLSLARRFGLLRHWIEVRRGNLSAVDASHVEAIDALVLSERPSGTTNLPGGWIVWREYDLLFLDRAKPMEPPEPVQISGPGVFCFGEAQIRVTRLAKPPALQPDRGDRVSLDLDSVIFPLTIRSRKRGDRYRPAKGPGTKKVAELLVDAKIPLRKRDFVPVLCDETGVIWVAGFAPDERAARNSLTAVCLRVSIKYK